MPILSRATTNLMFRVFLVLGWTTGVNSVSSQKSHSASLNSDPEEKACTLSDVTTLQIGALMRYGDDTPTNLLLMQIHNLENTIKKLEIQQLAFGVNWQSQLETYGPLKDLQHDANRVIGCLADIHRQSKDGKGQLMLRERENAGRVQKLFSKPEVHAKLEELSARIQMVMQGSSAVEMPSSKLSFDWKQGLKGKLKGFSDDMWLFHSIAHAKTEKQLELALIRTDRWMEKQEQLSTQAQRWYMKLKHSMQRTSDHAGSLLQVARNIANSIPRIFKDTTDDLSRVYYSYT